jgi:molybdate transport system permease protein
MSAETWTTLILSLKIAFCCVLVSLPWAVLLGWLLARRQFMGKILVEVIVHLPLVLPPVVIGYLLLIALGRTSPLGSFLEAIGLPLIFSWRGAAVASAIVGFPLLVRAIRLSIEAVDPRLEQASATLGRGRFLTFMRVTLPLSLPGVLTGCLLSFARSLSEFGATIVFVGNIEGETRTLPLAIFSAMQRPDGTDQAAFLVLLSVALAFLALGASELTSRRLKRRLAPS